jgi:hypothetical protein
MIIDLCYDRIIDPTIYVHVYYIYSMIEWMNYRLHGYDTVQQKIILLLILIIELLNDEIAASTWKWLTSKTFALTGDLTKQTSLHIFANHIFPS